MRCALTSPGHEMRPRRRDATLVVKWHHGCLDGRGRTRGLAGSHSRTASLPTTSIADPRRALPTHVPRSVTRLLTARAASALYWCGAGPGLVREGPSAGRRADSGQL